MLSKEQRNKIIYLLGQKTKSEIAEEVGCGRDTVYRIAKQFRECGNVERKKYKKRKRKTTEEEDQLIVSAAKACPTVIESLGGHTKY